MLCQERGEYSVPGYCQGNRTASERECSDLDYFKLKKLRNIWVISHILDGINYCFKKQYELTIGGFEFKFGDILGLKLSNLERFRALISSNLAVWFKPQMAMGTTSCYCQLNINSISTVVSCCNLWNILENLLMISRVAQTRN